ncbi:MAG: bifunctional diaminohydroxyphosphoribosylaminopyrimidine deaminase/5-amino-6-(5-phosphoribosylamino)uracil reductase RibD [Bdellovibrionales bacterium]
MIRDRVIKKGSKITRDEAYELSVILAEKGLGRVSPNPPVGCVIVSKHEQLLGWGYHEFYGGPHAEVNAVKSVEDSSELKGATVYVTLEPCAHQGKTPSCAKMLASLPISKVEYALKDPFSKVNGKGAEIVSQQGIEVRLWEGTEEKPYIKDLMYIMEPFLVNKTKNRPFISLKTAVSLDGQMGLASGESQWITGSEARRHGRLLRAYHDAVLVGVGTILKDNPRLDLRDTRFSDLENSVIVLDPKSQLKDRWESLSLIKERVKPSVYWITSEPQTVKFPGAEKVVNYNFPIENGVFNLKVLLQNLYENFELSSLYVEGGALTHSNFFAYGLMDRLYLFQGHKLLGTHQNMGWTNGLSINDMASALELSHIDTVWFQDSHLLIFRNNLQY